jgi:two-component system, NarL family, response regulator NreC
MDGLGPAHRGGPGASRDVVSRSAMAAREAEVRRMVALGHTNTEIAETLYLSVRTVETHRAHIQQKLRLGSRAELERYALAHGLVET